MLNINVTFFTYRYKVTYAIGESQISDNSLNLSKGGAVLHIQKPP